MDAYGMITVGNGTAHVVRVSRELLPEGAESTAPIQRWRQCWKCLLPERVCADVGNEK